MEIIKVFREWICRVMMAMVLVAGAGCSRKVYVPVESARIERDTLFCRQVSVERDTLVVRERSVESCRDSVAPLLDSLGRVIGYDRWHFVERRSHTDERRLRQLATLDSVHDSSASSEVMRQPYPVEVPVEVNRLHLWQKFLIALGLVFGIGASIRVVMRINRFLNN